MLPTFTTPIFVRMAIEPLTGEIRHFNISEETGDGEWLITSYQLDDSNIDLIQSWTEDFIPFPLNKINLIDLLNAIKDLKGSI